MPGVVFKERDSIIELRLTAARGRPMFAFLDVEFSSKATVAGSLAGGWVEGIPREAGSENEGAPDVIWP